MIEGGLIAGCSNCKDAPKDCKKSEQFGWSYFDETHFICPSLLVEPWHIEFIDAYRHYKNGMFSVPGGLDAQPVKYLEGIGIVDSEISLIEKEKIDGAR